jgi:hypothetical protein
VENIVAPTNDAGHVRYPCIVIIRLLLSIPTSNCACRDLYGAKLAVVGLGRIGKRVALIAQAFGAEVIYFGTGCAGLCRVCVLFIVPHLLFIIHFDQDEYRSLDFEKEHNVQYAHYHCSPSRVVIQGALLILILIIVKVVAPGAALQGCRLYLTSRKPHVRTPNFLYVGAEECPRSHTEAL